MMTVDDARAVARHAVESGDVEEIHLVKIGDRWWVSGYTLEYHPIFRDMDTTSLGKMDRALGYYAVAAPKVTAEIQSGKWAGAAENGVELARLRLLGVLMSDFPELQENPELLQW